ncbi:MAG: diguanylate cyclase [Candidatus Eutrophobiaceae bacterium]
MTGSINNQDKSRHHTSLQHEDDMTGSIDIDELSKLPLFKNTSKDILASMLIEQSSILELKKDQILLEHGEKNTHLYLVLEGELAVYLPGEREEPVIKLTHGDSVGEVSIIDMGAVSANVQANSDVRLLVIEDALLWKLVSASTNIARNLMQIIVDRIRANNRYITATQKIARKYQEESFTDPLTGIYNRRWLDRFFPWILKRHSENSSPLSVLMIDIDHFKQFNDTFGHQAGDDALRHVAFLSLKSLRPGDISVRYGGEEFMVILPESTSKEAILVAERLRMNINKHPIQEENSGKTLDTLTVSIGLAELRNTDDLNGLVKRADTALYKAKHSGRNKTESCEDGAS